MKKVMKYLIGIPITLLTLSCAFPAQAAIYAVTSNTQPGSVVSLRSYAPAPAPASGSVVSLRSYVSTPTSTPAPTSPSSPGSPEQVSNGSTVTGSRVVSLKGILNTGTPTASAGNPTTAPAPAPSTAPSPSTAPAPTSAPTPASAPASASGYPPISPVTSLSADEKLMIDMVNQERIAAGLKPLAVDYRLVSVAVAKAKDMKDNRYFDHISPTYGTPFAMMQATGLKVRWAAENIAANHSVAGAMAAFMKSPGHRANILDPKFTHIGIGIVYGTAYGNMYVQEFLQT